LLGAAGGCADDPADQDTVIKYTAEAVPNMEDFQEKMSMLVAIDQIDEKGEGPPVASVRLSAKSAEAADEIVSKVNGILDEYREMLEDTEDGLGVKVGITKTGDKLVEFSLAPLKEEIMSEGPMGDKGVMKLLTPLIKALRQSNAKMVWANEFDDFLAKPDTPMPEVFKGARGYFELNAAAKGKRVFLDALATNSGKKTQLAQELIKILTGAELTTVVGFNPANIASSLKVNEMLEGVSTPTGLREMMPQLLEDILDEMPLGEEMFMAIVDAGIYIIERLESVESLAISNVDLPVKYAANGLPANVGVTLSCTNVKPFGLLHYMSEPTVARMKEGKKDSSDSDSDNDNDSENGDGGGLIEMVGPPSEAGSDSS